MIIFIYSVFLKVSVPLWARYFFLWHQYVSILILGRMKPVPQVIFPWQFLKSSLVKNTQFWLAYQLLPNLALGFFLRFLFFAIPLCQIFSNQPQVLLASLTLIGYSMTFWILIGQSPRDLLRGIIQRTYDTTWSFFRTWYVLKDYVVCQKISLNVESTLWTGCSKLSITFYSPHRLVFLVCWINSILDA